MASLVPGSNEALQQAKKDICAQTALVGLIQNDNAVLTQLRVIQIFPKQSAIYGKGRHTSHGRLSVQNYYAFHRHARLG